MPDNQEAVLVPVAGARITTISRVCLIIALFVTLIFCLVLLFQVQMDASVAIRAYVGGEGLWAKAQKDAVHSIEDYAMTRDEADYQAYQRLIQVPLGDRRARIELQKENPDIAVALAGFVQGRNHPDDLESAIRFFRRFQHSAYMSRVIGHWTSGDRMIAELNEVAEALHDEIASGRNNPAGSAEVDPRALRRMLDALLDNAIKFNREGGAVVVRARRDDGWLEIAVADTGIGIAPENLPKLFQPFTQLDAGLARKHGGIGLGLALARRLVVLHGGTIEGESERGKHSTFTLRLPIREMS